MVRLKKENNKKINSYSKGLFLLLIVSLLLYLKLYVFADDLKSSSVDLPHSVTNNIWYEYGTLNKLEFNSSNFEYSDKVNEILSAYNVIESDGRTYTWYMDGNGNNFENAISLEYNGNIYHKGEYPLWEGFVTPPGILQR